VATKKYISPDVYPTTIRDNFRLLMGQHYLIDGNWNPEAKRLTFDPTSPGVRYADPTELNLPPRSPGESARSVVVKRKESTETVPQNPELFMGLSRDASTGIAKLKLKVTGDSINYSSINVFKSDIEYIFQNPTDGDGRFYDRTFQYEMPELGSDNESSSSYNYLIEEYEGSITNVREEILPNYYNISLIERLGDEATFEDASGSPQFTTPTYLPSISIGSAGLGTYEVYQDMKDHTLLYGGIEEDVIIKQGLFSDSYLQDEFDTSGLSLEEFLLSDLDKTLDIKYTNYYKQWPEIYIDLESEEQSSLETKAKNIIFSFQTSVLLSSPEIIDIFPTENKIPFYNSVYFQTETYPEFVTLDGRLVRPIAGELATNLLYASFGSHIAGVYDKDYVDPAIATNGDPRYAFEEKTFFDSANAQQERLSVSPPLHNYLLSSTGFENGSFNSFNAAITYHRDSANGVPKDSPQDTFDDTKKLFVDFNSSVLSSGQTRLALALKEDPTVDGPNFLEAVLIDNSILQTTQLSYEPGILSPSEYGVGGPEGLSSQANLSFNTTEGGNYFGRLYKESFEDGKTAHNETVMYRVAKYVGRNTNVDPIQDIWIPAQGIGSPASKINYVDSQVKYGQEYTYKVSAFKYVFGLKYKYEQSDGGEPKASIVETVLDADGIIIGYIVKWAGFANLFEDWEKAIAEIPLTSDPAWAVYANLYDPTYNYTLGDSVEDAPGFSSENAYFLSIGRLNEILETSWNLKPATGQPLVVNTFLGDHSPANGGVPSWRELFGNIPWSDDYRVTSDTPVDSSVASAFLLAARLTGNPISLPTLDPSDFTVRDWLKLWFGAFDNKIFRFRAPTSSDNPLVIFGAVQGFPPSHHVFLVNNYGPLLTPDWAGVNSYSIYGTPITGFEQLSSYSPDNLMDQEAAGNDNIIYYGSSIEKVEPGAGASTVELNGYEAEYEIVMTPVVEIVEVPYMTTTTSVLSKPPPPPEVTITPYRAINDTLLFSFASTNITVEQVPIPIEEGEAQLFNRHVEAQGKSAGEAIEFSQDDATSFFQIFRTDSPPTSYSDFAGKLRNTVSTRIPANNKIVRATSIAHQEKLQPNVKYWYTFRSVDYHGNFSNPTIVYEVELVDDGGAVYLLVKPHEFPYINNEVSSVDLMKFMEIIPTLDQVTADVSSNTDFTDPSDIPDVQLGADYIEEEDRIWDKTFKIRLTSKKTGKKIDFNLTFNKEDLRKPTS